MAVAICHYNCHVPNMEYEISTCALMKLPICGSFSGLQPLNREGFSSYGFYFTLNVLDVFCSCNTVISVSTAVELHRFLVSVSASGQYQQFLMVSESVDYVIQVPILFFMRY